MRTLACRVGTRLGDLLSLVVGAAIICLAVMLIGVIMPVSAPASVALVLHGGTTNAVSGMAASYGIEPYLPQAVFPTSVENAANKSVYGWLVLLTTFAVIGFFTRLAQQMLVAVLRWLGVAALRMIVDFDNNLQTLQDLLKRQQ